MVDQFQSLVNVRKEVYQLFKRGKNRTRANIQTDYVFKTTHVIIDALFSIHTFEQLPSFFIHVLEGVFVCNYDAVGKLIQDRSQVLFETCVDTRYRNSPLREFLRTKEVQHSQLDQTDCDDS